MQKFMQTRMKRIAVFMVALCLMVASLSPATVEAATVNSTVPAVEDVTKEAQETASYLMGIADYSTIKDTSTFYNASRNLFLAIRSGLDCQKKIDEYILAVKPLLDSDGKLNVPMANYGYENDIIACQAYLINTLTLADMNVYSFDNKNLVAALSTMLSGKTVDDFSGKLNTYHIGTIYTTVDTYSSAIANSQEIKTNLIDVLASKSSENGFDCWGWGGFADDYGVVLPGFLAAYTANETCKTIIDNSLAYAKNSFEYADNGAIASYGYISVNSTALGLAFFTTYNVPEKSATLYNALMSLELTDKPGQFPGYSVVSASQDALAGLVTYQYSLSGITNIFDTRKTITEPDNNGNVTEFNGYEMSDDASFVDANGNRISASAVKPNVASADKDTIASMTNAFETNAITYSDSDMVNFYDISLSTKSGIIVKLSNGKVKIKFSYKKNIDVSKYDILVYHLKDNGELESLPVTADASSFSVEADSFSPYAVVYKEKVVNSDNTETGADTIINTVQTYDSANAEIYMVLLLLSVCGLATVMRKKTA